VTLLERVDAHLVDRGILHALIGAVALAAHGVVRSTFDYDLLVTDAQVLDAEFWRPLGTAVSLDVRVGADDDPLAGVVRLRQDGQRDVHIMVGRYPWQEDVLARAVLIGGRGLPIAEPADLVVLKLYTGGSQDRWDIEQVLALEDGADIARRVESRAPALPARSRKLWLTLRPR